jgi:hypothetical protein
MLNYKEKEARARVAVAPDEMSPERAYREYMQGNVDIEVVAQANRRWTEDITQALDEVYKAPTMWDILKEKLHLNRSSK